MEAEDPVQWILLGGDLWAEILSWVTYNFW